MGLHRAAALLAIASGSLLASPRFPAFSFPQEPRFEGTSAIDALGVIEDVREISEPASPASIHLTLRTDSETLRVYLGPADFIHSFDFQLAKGDRVQVAGWKVRSGATTLVFARELRRNEVTLSFRDKRGRPLWKDNTMK